jgi:hypothetical protein
MLLANDDDHPHNDDHDDHHGGFFPGLNFTIDLTHLGQTTDKKEEPPKPHAPSPSDETNNPHAPGGDNPGLSTHDEQLYPQIVGMEPIQVVQDPPHASATYKDIPLVEAKKTMVRVYVKLPKGMSKSAAECKLDWNGEEVGDISAELVLDAASGRTLVISDDEKTMTDTQSFLSALNRVTPSDQKTLDQNSDYYWAYNFTFEKGKLAPKDLVLKATLFVNGALVSQRTESNDPNPEDGEADDFKIKPFNFHDGYFHLVVGAYAVQNNPWFTRGFLRNHPEATESEITRFMRAALTGYAESYKQELLAVFPIPDANVQIMIRAKIDPDAETRARMVIVGVPSGGPLFSNWALLGGGDPVTGRFPDAVDGDARTPLWQDKRTFTALIAEQYPNSDAILMVTTNNFKVKGSNSSYEGWTPNGIEGVHYIDEFAKTPDPLTAAHEIGHDDRFLGTLHWFSTFSAHPFSWDIDTLEDGWNAGAHLTDLTTAMNSYNLMAEGAADQNKSTHRFIVLKEYRKLLNVMVKGGSDPLLLTLDGILGSDGNVLLSPIKLSMGEALPMEKGAGALVFTDATGKNLGTWNFVLHPADNDPKWEKFSTQAPVPDNTASATLQLPGGKTQKFDFPASPPQITWHDVQYDPAKEVLHASFTLKGDPAQSYLASFACQSDDHGLFDLPDAQTHLSPGDHTVDISLSDVPQSAHAKVSLTVTKDLAFAQATSAEFAVPNHPPEAYIYPVYSHDDNGENSDDTSDDNQIEGLHAMIYDQEDQFNLTTAWSEATQVLGTGRDLTLQQIRALGEGKHKIVLTVTDTDGLKSTDHVVLRINHDGDIALVLPPRSYWRYFPPALLAVVVLLVAAWAARRFFKKAT